MVASSTSMIGISPSAIGYRRLQDRQTRPPPSAVGTTSVLQTGQARISSNLGSMAMRTSVCDDRPYSTGSKTLSNDRTPETYPVEGARPAPSRHGSASLRGAPLGSPDAARRAQERASGPRRSVSHGPTGAGLAL